MFFTLSLLLCFFVTTFGQTRMSMADEVALANILEDFKNHTSDGALLEKHPINRIKGQLYLSFLAKINHQFIS